MSEIEKVLKEIEARLEAAKEHPEAVGPDNSYMRGGVTHLGELAPIHKAMLKVVEIAEQAIDGKTRLVVPGDTVHDRMVKALNELRKTLDGVK